MKVILAMEINKHYPEGYCLKAVPESEAYWMLTENTQEVGSIEFNPNDHATWLATKGLEGVAKAVEEENSRHTDAISILKDHETKYLRLESF